MKMPATSCNRLLQPSHYLALLFIGVCAAMSTSMPVAHAGTPAAADVKLTQVIDRATVKGDLTALRDPQSNTTVLVYRAGVDQPRIFVGDGKQFFEQIVLGFTGDAPDMTNYVVAPRARPLGRSNFDLFKGTYTYSCDEKDIVSLVNIPITEVTKILANATLRTSAVVHRTAVFARDAAGIYYFADRLHDEYGGSGFRVFVGKRGKLKQLPLVDVANDEAGMVFETKTGEIRLTVDKNKERTVTWNVKGKTKNLTWLDPQLASFIIHRELGIYSGFGTLCDDR